MSDKATGIATLRALGPKYTLIQNKTSSNLVLSYRITPAVALHVVCTDTVKIWTHDFTIQELTELRLSIGTNVTWYEFAQWLPHGFGPSAAAVAFIDGFAFVRSLFTALDKTEKLLEFRLEVDAQSKLAELVFSLALQAQAATGGDPDRRAMEEHVKKLQTENEYLKTQLTAAKTAWQAMTSATTASGAPSGPSGPAAKKPKRRPGGSLLNPSERKRVARGAQSDSD
eukprot:TRINITY_DN9003_c0_g1_i1.p1 TRINITY_DN9003_c0_g1~~TRINITY_DN9003_c0_g1_i1.p1  ORF type:complete len:227 (-),score=32.41 TRINITY_DN9003_c0_g1_i1:143-823(-)